MSSAVPLSLPPATSTGIGSLPGTEAGEAVAMVLAEAANLPYLPELPARGPGADMIGRGAAMLTELHVGLTPSGWRFVEHPGRDARRAESLLAEDLDALTERGEGYTGALKVQVPGPWTLASAIELRHGDKALADPGACRDIAASLADGARAHVAEVRRRLPGADPVILQLDEPALPGALAGTTRTASGFATLPAVEEQLAEATLRSVVEALAADAVPVAVHCCAVRAPIALLDRAGAAGIAADLGLLTTGADEAIGSFLDAGGVLFAGVVATVEAAGAPPAPVSTAVDPVRALWHRLGLPLRTLAAVVPVPVCGLAGASPSYARSATARCRQVAHDLAEVAEV